MRDFKLFPSIGDMVHYVGAGPYGPIHFPAVVCEIADKDQPMEVSLQVFGRLGIFYKSNIPCEARFTDTQSTWHWPEKPASDE